MAARRLIIVLLVLFAVSIVAAMIAPERRGPLLGDRSSSSTDSSSTTTTAPEEAAPAKTTTAEPAPGEALTVRIDASEAKPESVAAFVGDQLALNVGSEKPRAVEIPAFGVTDFAAPDAPASFDLLLRVPGRLPIIDGDTGELLGRLDVAEPRHDPGSGGGDSGGHGRTADGGNS
jgi:hypothetical protein